MRMAKSAFHVFSGRTFAWISSVVGLSIAAHLTALDLQRRVPLCGPGESCEAILTSRYAHLGSVPVSAFGMLFYAAAALFLSLEMAGLRRFKTVGFVWSGIGLLTSVALMYVAVFKIHAMCQWCLGSAVCTAVLFAAWGHISAQEPRVFGATPRFVVLVSGAFIGFLAFLVPFFGEGLESQATVPYFTAALADQHIKQMIPAGRHSIGRGPPSIVFFGDLACPACHYWYPRFREAAEKEHAKLVYRHFIKHERVREMTVLAERVPPNQFWSYIDEAIKSESDSGDRTAFMAKWKKNGLALTEEEANDQVDADSNLAKEMGLRVTPSIVWIDAKGAQTVMSPSRAYDRLTQPGSADLATETVGARKLDSRQSD